jgi:BirA family transcriptional regulator, biotin operon repressor / biotin---[acetyl-CoA-carboxylase] ligase
MTSGEERGAKSEPRSFAPRSSFVVPDFVRHVEIHDELPSTNDRAMQLTLFAALETPALIIARRQLAGRGRGRNPWWSADGALTFSVVLETAQWGITAADWPRLSLTTGVAVCDALREELPETAISIKWPNDILVDDRKVCGILLESPGGAAPAKDRLVVGIGINVNNSFEGAPREAGSRGTALCDVTGHSHDADAILVAFLHTFDQRLHQLGRNDPELPLAWQQFSWLTNKNVDVDTGGRTISGTCLGIADDGGLLVRTPLATERIYSGSVRPVP